jgi:hypothetical protein
MLSLLRKSFIVSLFLLFTREISSFLFGFDFTVIEAVILADLVI